jgi:hypothetical protein
LPCVNEALKLIYSDVCGVIAIATHNLDLDIVFRVPIPPHPLDPVEGIINASEDLSLCTGPAGVEVWNHELAKAA